MLALILLGIAILGFLALRRKPLEMDILKLEPQKVAEDILAIVKAPKAKTVFSIGDTLHHNETGEKVEIIDIPAIVDGEYTIRWPSGAIGEIHGTQLVSWFSR